MLVKYCKTLAQFEDFINENKNIKIKFINSSEMSFSTAFIVIYTEKILPKIIKSILGKKSKSNP